MSYNQEQDSLYRTGQLSRLGETMLDGKLVSKVDHIATIYMLNCKCYHVYRRYNSVYDIIIEDEAFKYVLQKDMTIRESIATLLHLSEAEQDTIQTHHVASFRHHTSVNSSGIMLLKWSEVQEIYLGITAFLAYTDKHTLEQQKKEQQNNILNYENVYRNDICLPCDDTTAKKRRRSEVELLEPLPSSAYNLRNKKPKM